MKPSIVLLIACCILAALPIVSAYDGNWTQVNASAGFPERYQHTAAVFGGNQWVIGGLDGSTYYNDTWYSADGNVWYRANASAEFPARSWHATAVFNNRIWVIGGTTSTDLINDVWSSPDGRVWEAAIRETSFPERNAFAAAVFKNKLWVIGGQGCAGNLNDTWNSTDGITWEATNGTLGSGFTSRYGHAVIVYHDRMWLTGGNDPTVKADVWYTDDGITWTRATGAAEFGPRYVHSMAVYDDRMWVIGGLDDSGGVSTTIYSSTDGITWVKSSLVADPPLREGHTTVTMGKKIWLAGGYDGSALANSNDTWSFLASPVASFTANPVTGVAPLAVTFTNTSTGYPDTYLWTFGDGTTSTTASPSHTYTTAGTYTVSLKATNTDGTNTTTKTGHITVTAPTPEPTQGPSGGDGPAPVRRDQKAPGQQHPSAISVNVGHIGHTSIIRVDLTGFGIKDTIVTAAEAAGPSGNLPPPPGIVYEYVDITPARFTEISESNIVFYVPVAWIEANHLTPQEIILYHDRGTGWEALPTTLTGIHEGNAYYTAAGTGFSRFAITGQLNRTASGGNATATVPAYHAPAATSGATPLPGTTRPVAAQQPVVTSTTIPPAAATGESPLFAIAIIAVIILAIAAGLFLVRRWWIRRQNPALFFEYH